MILDLDIIKELETKDYHLCYGGIDNFCWCGYFNSVAKFRESSDAAPQCKKYCCEERHLDYWVYTNGTLPKPGIISRGNCDNTGEILAYIVTGIVIIGTTVAAVTHFYK